MRSRSVNRFMLLHVMCAIFFLNLISACGGGGQAARADKAIVSQIPSSSSSDSTSSSTSTSTSSDTSTSTSVSTSTVPTLITAVALTQSTVKTTDSIQNNCTSVSFTLTASNVPVSGTNVDFSINVASGNGTPSTIGSITPTSVLSDSSGNASTTFCAATTIGTVTISAQAGVLSANSGVITIERLSNYTFQAVDEAGDPLTSNVINLNLINSGPIPCSYAYFQLKLNKVAVTGASATFSSGSSYPTGLKLATLTQTGSTSTNSAGQQIAVTTATSDINGIFAIPVCSGTGLGTTSISGLYVGNNSENVVGSGPTVYVNSGLTSWENMSIQYQQPDARTLIAALDGSSSQTHSFTIKLNSTGGGGPIANYPVTVATETAGSLFVSNGGLPDSSGNVSFTLSTPHLDTYRPYVAYEFPSTSLSAQSLATTKCDPTSMSQLDETNHSSEIWYTDVAKNWKLQVVYAVRGSDFFYDANRNGIYSTGGCGFYDVNQNGFYDSGTDTLLTTLSPCSWTGAWFIDQGSPFVSLDKSNIYQSGVDIPVGGTYTAPSSTYRADTMIWKSFVAPIYMGTTSYALRHAAVTYNNLSDLTSSSAIATTYFSDLQTQGWLTHTAPTHFSATTYSFSTSASSLDDWRYFFAHSKCGTPMPGGTSLSVNFVDTYSPQYGIRAFTAYFYQQLGDQGLEPLTHLLSNAGGSSTATINYNVLNHAASSASYPVEFRVNAASCSNACTGDVATPGVACDAHQATINLTADSQTISNSVSLPAVQTCTCVTSATFSAGTCSCPAGTTSNGSACI